jgi:hypothetical protein
MWIAARPAPRAIAAGLLLAQLGCAARGVPAPPARPDVTATPAPAAPGGVGPAPAAASPRETPTAPAAAGVVITALGVVASPAPPAARHRVPSHARAGARTGMREGARLAAVVPFVLCVGGAYTIAALVFCPAAAAAAGVGALVGAPVGALVGAARGPSRATVRSADAALGALVADLGVPAMLRDRVHQAIRRETSQWSVLAAEARPRSAGAPGDVIPEAGTVDALLELEVRSVQVAGPFGRDPDVPPVAVAAHARLVRQADGAVLREEDLAWRGGEGLTLAEWPRDAAELRAALDQACRAMAGALAGWFGARSADDAALAPGAEAR